MHNQKFFKPALLLTFVLLQISHVLSDFPAEVTNSRHQVSIRISARDETTYGAGHICSGVLISNFTVLTAASCVLNPDTNEFYSAEELSVAMGSLSRSDNAFYTHKTPVLTVKPHGRFNRRTLANNLALLVIEGLEFEFPFTYVPLVTSSEIIQEGTDCYVLGWRTKLGELTDVLMQSNVKTINRKNCLEEFPFATFCSSENAPTLDTCVGELGSGLICGGTLRGIVSRDCNLSTTQYTDVSQIYNWIWLSHLDESLKMIDNDILKYFVFGALDYVAYLINTPKIADDFEVIKYIF